MRTAARLRHGTGCPPSFPEQRRQAEARGWRQRAFPASSCCGRSLGDSPGIGVCVGQVDHLRFLRVGPVGHSFEPGVVENQSCEGSVGGRVRHTIRTRLRGGFANNRWHLSSLIRVRQCLFILLLHEPSSGGSASRRLLLSPPSLSHAPRRLLHRPRSRLSRPSTRRRQ